MSRYRLLSPEDKELTERLTLDAFPRSAAYNPRWVLENLMGPNVLWLTEALSQRMDLQPGMRVLDMGCGKAISSIFLAREFGVQVWANDLWICATENWQRIREAGMEDRVFPIHAEAHALPYAEGFFDALVSMDAYHYFGTNDLYLDYYSRFVREGGQVGVIAPGLQQEFTDGLPEHLLSYWQGDFSCFHSPDWWSNHWLKSGVVENVQADFLPDRWKQWLIWSETCLEYDYIIEQFREWVPKEVEMLRTDAGRNLGFSRIVAQRKSAA